MCESVLELPLLSIVVVGAVELYLQQAKDKNNKKATVEEESKGNTFCPG